MFALYMGRIENFTIAEFCSKCCSLQIPLVYAVQCVLYLLIYVLNIDRKTLVNYQFVDNKICIENVFFILGDPGVGTTES